MNQQEIRKWHNFVPMVLCYSSVFSPGVESERTLGMSLSIIEALYVTCHYNGSKGFLGF